MSQRDHPLASTKLVLIAGLQKSGTTLLLRLLADHTSAVSNPFTAVEGHDFWGNIPSHAPDAFPAGTVYWRHGGELGHEISAVDADPHVRRVLHERLASLNAQSAVIVNKNPYHTVRLPWLKAIFPDSLIVATVRRAVPNVFSLLKKHIRADERDRPWRQDRWYGVKPRHWRTMIADTPLVQCANQWSAVMEKLWDDREHVDLIVGYRQLCMDPQGTVRHILRGTCGDAVASRFELPRLHCHDNEYRHGAALRSKNEAASLEPTATGAIELPPLTGDEVERIRSRCAEIESRFEMLRPDDGFD